MQLAVSPRLLLNACGTLVRVVARGFALAVFGILLGSVSQGQTPTDTPPEKAAIQMIQRLDTARADLSKQFNQIRAKGRVSGWVQVPGDADPRITLDAEMMILQDGSKFHLQLLHAAQPNASPPQAERLELVVYDGKNIYTFFSSGKTQRGGVFFELPAP